MDKTNIPKNTLLGTLCGRGHIWNNTDKSLRSVKHGKACIICRREDQKLYYDNNRDKVKERNRLHGKDSRRNLKDGYIKRLLGFKSDDNDSAIKELIKAKRWILKLQRIIWEMS